VEAKNVHYKWSKIFAARRYGGGEMVLDALEQDEILQDILKIASPVSAPVHTGNEGGELLAFAKRCFYKGFEKCEKDDANCFTAWREEAASLMKTLSAPPSSEVKVDEKAMFENMQYYMEYCEKNGYVTPMEWLTEHKHF
jgi:hypothetical protein